jgi:hypothetical protein
VKTESLYAAIFDLASPANTFGMVQTTLSAASARAKESGQPWAALFHFNEALDNRARGGELMTWTLLFDGVFKVAIEVLTPTNDISLDEHESSNASDESQLLRCPSGKITVACLGALGRRDLATIIVIEPGIYHAYVHRNFDEEDKHGFLEKPSDYPPTEGPDWHIRLQRQTIDNR